MKTTLVILAFVASIGVSHAATLDLSSSRAYQFRTRLRDAWKEPANFAGHYVLATWGCGTDCIEGAAIDKRTGRIIFLSPLDQYVPEAAGNETNFNIRSPVIKYTAFYYDGSGTSHDKSKDFYVVFDGKNFHRR